MVGRRTIKVLDWRLSLGLCLDFLEDGERVGDFG